MFLTAFFLLACTAVMLAVFDDAEDGDRRMAFGSWKAMTLGVLSSTAVVALLPAGAITGWTAATLLGAGYWSAWKEARPRVAPRVDRFFRRLDAWGRDPASRAFRIQERIDRAEVSPAGWGRLGVFGVLPLWIGLATADPVSLFLGGVALTAPAAGMIRELSGWAEAEQLSKGLQDRLSAGDGPERLDSTTVAA